MTERQFPSLSSQQAAFVVQKVTEALGPEVAAMVSRSGLNPNHMIRFLSIASLCRNRRQQRGLSLKDVSQELKIPQYRLRAIEGGMLRQVVLEALTAYTQYLGLADQLARWREENRDVYDEIGDGPK
jgi:ribosome-binding protein aMBF1 (putative translation factor)